MNNTINFTERKEEKTKVENEKTEKLEKDLKAVDVDAVYRALTHAPEKEGNVNNSLRNKSDYAESKRYFENIAIKIDLDKKSRNLSK